jgi:hypothetical protein
VADRPTDDDINKDVQKIKSFVDVGFTEVTLVQIGGDRQEPFSRWVEQNLLPALHQL